MKSRYEVITINYRQQLATLRKYSLQIVLSTSNSFLLATNVFNQGEISQQYLPTIRFQCWTFVDTV